MRDVKNADTEPAAQRSHAVTPNTFRARHASGWNRVAATTQRWSGKTGKSVKWIFLPACGVIAANRRERHDKERGRIANRTRAVVAVKEAQGAVLGNRTNLAEAAAKGAAAQRTAADAFAANVLPVVRQIQAAGATTHRAIAEALNARGIRTARSGQWHVSTVQNLLAREGAARD